jgi:hypothetical protein
MDDAMRARFVKALEAKGITKGKWAEASVAVKKPNGRRLGKTYLRDAILRGKGKDEYVQWFCAHHGISWDYVKFNKGPTAPLLLIEGPRPSPEEAERGFITIDPLKLIDVVEGVCRMCGASPKRAARLAREVLISVQGRESSD